VGSRLDVLGMKNKIPLIVSLLVLSLALFIKASDFPIVSQLQLKVFDTFQKKHPRKYTEQPIKIIDIDDQSLSKLGQWPWPRNTLADLINKLNEAGAAAIALDIVFAEEDRTSPKHILKLWHKEKDLSYLLNELPDHDNIFADAIANANVATGFVLIHKATKEKAKIKAGFSFTGDDPRPSLAPFIGYVKSLDDIEEAGEGNGALNSIPDADGILRRMPTIFRVGNNFVPSLSSEVLRIAQGAKGYIIKSTGASDEESFGQSSGITAIKNGEFEIPTDSTGKFWLYYTPYVADRYIPAWKIIENQIDPKEIEGKILLIGTSAAGLRDIRSTPLNPTSSGVEVHTQALEQILTGEYLKRPDWMKGAEIITMVITGLILIVMMLNLSAIWGALFTIASLSYAIWFSWIAFKEYHFLIDPVTPGIAIILLYLSASLSRYISSENEKKQVRNAFSHYMSPALVDQLARNPDSLQLGGEIKNLTLLFCDIRGFTTISENFDAHGLTQFINRFLTPMTTIILDNKGTIDKYMGDCIMAFWNAPLNDEQHTQHACISALQMIKELDVLNAKLEAEAKEAGKQFIPIHIGIGLNTGDCCVGNMGSDQRFDYSVLGDDVNLASRLEGQSKTYGVDIVIGENTQKSVANMATIELDLITVKGKTKPIRVYTLLGNEELAQNSDFINFAKTFHQMLDEYRDKKFKEAEKTLRKAQQIHEKISDINITGLFDLYYTRISAFIKSPPPKEWDGVFIATSK